MEIAGGRAASTPRHVTSLTADAANNVGGKVSLFGAVVLAMADVAAVLANLVLVVAQGTVEHGELSQLSSLVIVVAFRSRSGLCESSNPTCLKQEGTTHNFNDRIDQLDTFAYFVLSIGDDETVQVFVVVVRRAPHAIRSTLSLLDRTFASNRDLGARLPLHLLQRVATRTDEETEEVNLGELFDGNEHLFLRSTAHLAGVEVVLRRPEHGIVSHCLFDQGLCVG